MSNDIQEQSDVTQEQSKSLEVNVGGDKENGSHAKCQCGKLIPNPNDDMCGEPEYIKE